MGFQVDHEQLRVLFLGIGVGRGDHRRPTHDRLLIPGRFDVALAQMNQMKHLGHYIEKALEAVEPKSETAAGELQNVIPEQSVAPDAAEVPVDTAANETPARE